MKFPLVVILAVVGLVACGGDLISVMGPDATSVVSTTASVELDHPVDASTVLPMHTIRFDGKCVWIRGAGADVCPADRATFVPGLSDNAHPGQYIASHQAREHTPVDRGRK